MVLGFILLPCRIVKISAEIANPLSAEPEPNPTMHGLCMVMIGPALPKGIHYSAVKAVFCAAILLCVFLL